MESMIKKMRADWVVVAEDRLACGEWSEEDEAEIGEVIKSAIATRKEDQIICWARWLGDLAASTIALKAIALGINAKIREAVRKEHESMKKAA
jgi:hypothetical protein